MTERDAITEIVTALSSAGDPERAAKEKRYLNLPEEDREAILAARKNSRNSGEVGTG